MVSNYAIVLITTKIISLRTSLWFDTLLCYPIDRFILLFYYYYHEVITMGGKIRHKL